MRKLITAGLLCMLAVIFASALAEAGEAPYTISVKITCDNTIAEATADVLLCTTSDCGTYKYEITGLLACGGTGDRVRTSGGRFEIPDFEPWTFQYTINARDQFGVLCSESGLGVEVGSTVTCGDFRSPKLSVGRPH